MSITIKSRKSKAKRLQNQVRDDIRDRLGIPPEDIRVAIMGESGADVKAGLLKIECKNAESLNIYKALVQAESNADPSKGEVPIVVFKKNQTDTYATVTWDYLLTLLAGVTKNPYTFTKRDVATFNDRMVDE